MGTQLDSRASSSSTATASRVAERAPCAVWPRATQCALGVVLVTFFALLVGKSWFQSLQAGSGTVPLQRVDLNSASHAELRLLPGVGEQLAQRIALTRAKIGSFQAIEDLRKVPGVGPATLERLRGWVFIAAPSAPPAVAPPPPTDVPHLNVELLPRTGGKPRKGTNLAGPIDVNSADGPQLMQIPGIGPALSKRIIEQRTQRRFETVADLRRVPGIGVKTLEKIRPFVVTR